IPVFTVAENVILGSEPTAGGRLATGRAIAQIETLTRQYEFALDPRERVANLSVGEQQRVEIIKVLYRGAELLILDEPTAVLVPQEVEELFVNLRRLRDQGKTIIFISHILEEVLEIADRVTVLRRGEVVGTVPAGQTTKAQLAEMMVGRPVLLEITRPAIDPGEARLAVDGLLVRGPHGRPVVRDLSLQVRRGEIYGIAGVQGNGQTELVEAIMGLRPIAAGSVRVDGADVTHAGAGRVRLRGLAHIPEDRQRRGLVLPMQVRENLILGHHHRGLFTNGPLLDQPAIEEFARERIRDYDIRVPEPTTPALALSGGNQQKVIVAREFAFAPGVLLAAQPTRGLDVGAIEFVWQQLMEAKARGMAVLLVSADLDEILSLADRIGVIYRGELVAEFPRGAATPQELGLYMTGTKRRAVDATA
ncbi:MAG: ABC transporter ATP-binding protein, partial [Armatimonadetes bacterium]|nr:ABC transporter ATP-binding protein [Armatimonadota bacterium]